MSDTQAGRRHVWIPAYVLHQRAWKESSAIVQLICTPGTRIDAVARGVRGQGAKNAALQLFTPLQVRLAGRGELMTLAGVEAGTTRMLVGEAFACGCYLNEIVLRCVHKFQEIDGIFAAYAQALDGLASARYAESLRVFEREMLIATGYWPDLRVEYDSGRLVEEGAFYRLSAQHGVCRSNATSGADIFTGRAVLAAAAGEFSDLSLQGDVRRLLQWLLQPQLGSAPLKSRALLKPANVGQQQGETP